MLEEFGRAYGWVEHVEGDDGYYEENALEANKEALTADEGARPHSAQFHNAEGTPPKDADGGEREGGEN